jgi:tRNA (cytidine/uridine-2'-O-)-methyltransferase
VFHLILYQPEIPPNTGNAIRLCANVGAEIHLIRPLGFSIDDRRLRRAGLDYAEYTRIREHADLDACLKTLGADATVYGLSTKGQRSVYEPAFRPGDAFLLGPETRGLPEPVLARLGPNQVLRIPLRPHNRSLNLSNAAAIVLYEAWRQNGFAGAC